MSYIFRATTSVCKPVPNEQQPQTNSMTRRRLVTRSSSYRAIESYPRSRSPFSRMRHGALQAWRRCSRWSRRSRAALLIRARSVEQFSTPPQYAQQTLLPRLNLASVMFQSSSLNGTENSSSDSTSQRPSISKLNFYWSLFQILLQLLYVGCLLMPFLATRSSLSSTPTTTDELDSKSHSYLQLYGCSPIVLPGSLRCSYWNQSSTVMIPQQLSPGF